MNIPFPNSRTLQAKPVQEKKISEMERIKILLDYLGIVNEYIPKNEENKFEQIYISFLNEDQQPSGILLNLSFISDFDGTAELTEEVKTHRLQFFALVGESKGDQDNIIELMNLIVRFNNFLPIGLFGMNEENTVYFRYTLPSKERTTNNILLVEIIEMIEFYLFVLGNNIAEFLAKRKTHSQALEDGLNSLTLETENSVNQQP